ncbi:hypothetical protein SAMD00023353_2300300 [Rosellinia necatrix]|uniref:Uncharacterized protein n=1 Tax=Rosellinia necatrix TaxID=77044 RepID=A0A1S8A819_ROSNE|nr:hypothetical protein SAMD00023353_2300300 [Rosellinia necatrix]
MECWSERLLDPAIVVVAPAAAAATTTTTTTVTIKMATMAWLLNTIEFKTTT